MDDQLKFGDSLKEVKEKVEELSMFSKKKNCKVKKKFRPVECEAFSTCASCHHWISYAGV